MPKVKVEIKDGGNVWRYEGDWILVAMMHDNPDIEPGRWIQRPAGWKDGLGLFHMGVELLRSVAEQAGDQVCIHAARAALDTISTFEEGRSEKSDGSGTEDHRRTKKHGRISKRSGSGTKRDGCDDDDSAPTDDGEGADKAE